MFKDILKQEREKLGLTQSELSKQLNLSQQTIGSWESGRTEPNSDTLQNLADLFSVSVDYLLGRGIIYPNSPNKFEICDAYGQYFSIDEQMDQLITRLENMDHILHFNNKVMNRDARTALSSSLKNLMMITERINKD